MTSADMIGSEPVSAVVKAVSKSPKAKRSSYGLWSAGGLGFVAGALCWHFVGFWGFIKEAVFFSRTEGPVQIGTRAAGAPAKAQNRQPGSAAAALAASAGSCSFIIKGRDGSEALSKPCDGPAIKFHGARNIAKADRGDFGPTPVPTLISGPATPAPAVGGWLARIEQPNHQN
jgi:hypothetical protein